MITRLEKSIDLKKNSLWCRGPRFPFGENQKYSKIDSCENKKFVPETFTQDSEREIKKNVVINSNKIEHLIPNTVDNTVKASNYSDINRLFRVTAFVVRLVGNLFRQVKGENLKLFYLCWCKRNSWDWNYKNYENLSNRLTLKFDKENIVRCYIRLENGDKNSHPTMLWRNHGLTKLVVLRCHKKFYHNGVNQTLNELLAEFWINCGKSYVRKLLNSCFICNPEVKIAQKTQIYHHIE